MFRLLSGASVAALLIGAPAAAFAQDQDATSVEEIVATGTLQLNGVKADTIGGSLTVIDEVKMEERQVRFVSDVLRDVPGVAVSRTGAPGGLTQVRIRGAEGNHTLTLIDGIESNDPFQGEFDFASLAADEAGRVEVLRGQQSALYGSDAIAGVVQYVTPTGRQLNGFRGRVEAGSFGAVNAAVIAGKESGAVDWTVSATSNNTNGYPTQTDGLGKRDVGVENLAFGGKLSVKLSDALKLRAVVRSSQVDGDTNNAPFASGSLVLDSPGVGYEYRNVYYLAGIDYQALEGRWTNSLQFQGVDAQRKNFNSVGTTGYNESNRNKIQLVSTYRLEIGGLSHAFTGAIDAEYEKYQNGLTGVRRASDNFGLVADYALQWNNRGGLGLSIRHDKNDLFQNATTYRAQVYHDVVDNVRLRAAAGTGIKNPTFFELFGFGPTFVGNPLLDPEESAGWEVGADFTFLEGKLRTGLTYFDSTLDSEIFSYFSGARPPACPAPAPGLNTVCNRTTESTQSGVELYGNAELEGGWSVDASYTYLDAQENGFQEIRRPPHQGSLAVNWQSSDDRFNVNVAARYQGKNQDSNFSILTPGMFANDPDFTVLPTPASRVELPAFVLLNAAAEWKVNDTVELFGRVENLLDEEYYEVITFRTPGRAFYAGVRARF